MASKSDSNDGTNENLFMKLITYSKIIRQEQPKSTVVDVFMASIILLNHQTYRK
jgi:hypothetical protein